MVSWIGSDCVVEGNRVGWWMGGKAGQGRVGQGRAG